MICYGCGKEIEAAGTDVYSIQERAGGYIFTSIPDAVRMHARHFCDDCGATYLKEIEDDKNGNAEIRYRSVERHAVEYLETHGYDMQVLRGTVARYSRVSRTIQGGYMFRSPGSKYSWALGILLLRAQEQDGEPRFSMEYLVDTRNQEEIKSCVKYGRYRLDSIANYLDGRLIAIEVDGNNHNAVGSDAHDAVRDARIMSVIPELQIIRVTTKDMDKWKDGKVLEHILSMEMEQRKTDEILVIPARDIIRGY